MPGGAFSLDLIEERPGQVVLEVAGVGAADLFRYESGGHRFQRIPPTEKRGRVQTSTITVAVLPVCSDVELNLSSRDFTWQATRGSGAGGQHRNKTSSAVILTHVPTGLTVRCESERSQHQNRRTAMTLLQSRLVEAARVEATQNRSQDRRKQVGSGQRGDKVRTCAVQRDQVVDHQTGRQWTWRQYERGQWD